MKDKSVTNPRAHKKQLKLPKCLIKMGFAELHLQRVRFECLKCKSGKCLKQFFLNRCPCQTHRETFYDEPILGTGCVQIQNVMQVNAKNHSLGFPKLRLSPNP